MRRHPGPILLAFALAGLAACHHVPPAGPRPLFPITPGWTTPLPAVAEGTLAADGGNIYVATHDGGVRALNAANGRVRWTVEDRLGVVGAQADLVVLRQEDGTVWALNARTGATRWRAGSGVRGTLAPVLYKDAVVVAGDGLSRLDAATGETKWSSSDVHATTVPLVTATAVLVGEADGALRSHDLATGRVLWSFPTAHPLLAPPTLDADGRILLGTTDRRFVSLDPSKKGDQRWRWRIGGDVAAPPVAVGGRVLFTTHEDVLYALNRGNGHLDWRAALPSRPLSGPLVYGDSVLVACFGSRPGETFLIGYDIRTGRRQGDLKAPGELRTPPIIVGDLLAMALRERAVATLALGSVAPNP